MKEIAYLCSQNTIPGSSNRRTDAYEHDNMVGALRPAFANLDLRLVEVCWDDPDIQWDRSFAAAIIGTTWDYWDRHELFLATLELIESTTPLFNSSAFVRWNSNKRYLKELATRGAKLIPTEWIDSPTRESIEAAFKSLGCEDMVVKRQVGAGADGQHRLKAGDPIPEMNHPMMAQPFLSSIQSEGELSLIFVDGEFSHALIKRAKGDDYRIQSTYGGTEEAISPAAKDLAMAAAVLDALDQTPLYARVDMLRAETGELYLMELELIEPYLYPLEGPELGRRMAEAISRRLA
ncbi:ATP-grasp domain-containing protein [Mariniblastus fucicola]|uniref:Cycloserine biosynthesis protein DcsG n=1 Tax=Mariniblastus fucicola TaxID=980251 RepID=A0A5B9PC54_9BACT|nr:hypothetical protein [Mariniblastus fucicola]QEG23069.1 Cycloserine biosynthesis protein DcsG [Mariniblastus fucicola]